MKGDDRCFPRRTLAVVPQCKSMIRSKRIVGTPIPCMAFHSAVLSTEAAFRSTWAMWRGFAGIHGGSRSVVIELEWRPALIDIL